MNDGKPLGRHLFLIMLLSANGGLVRSALAEPAADSGTLEEITVTARRREERLQDVPMSVSAFTTAAIRDARIGDVKDVAARVPNFSIVEAQQPGVALISVRGVGQARNGEPPIAMVIDGVQTSNAYQITQNLFDVESIQVLKGPQSAVYGRNAIGGAVIVNTRKPTNDFAGAVEASGGTGSDWRASGFISGPIVPDKLLFRLSASWRDFDGDIDSLNTPTRSKANPDRNTDVRLAVLGKLSESVSLDVRYAHLDQKAGASWYTPVPPGESKDEPRAYINPIAGIATRKLDDASVKLDVDWSSMRLTSVTAYSKIKTGIYESINYSLLDGLSATQDQDTDNVSEELRLTSTGDAPLKWLAGLYFLHSRLPQDTNIYLDSGYYFLFGIPPGTPGPIPLSQAKVTNTQNAYAAFGQISYRYASGWELAGALRVDIDDRKQVDRAAVGQPEYSKRFSAVQPKVDLSYHISEDTLAYGSIGEGFRSGGFNATDRITRAYQAEKNWSAETGFKTALLNNRVNLTGAVFYTRVKDRQVYVLDIVNSAQTIANPIPRAEIYGLEFDVLARPVPQLDLALSGALTNSRITKYDTSLFAGLPVDGDFTGNKLPQTPGYSYAASAQYRFALPGMLTLTPRVEIDGSGGDYYWELDNQDKRGAINRVNARLSLSRGPLSLTAYAENLFDEKYVLEFVQAAWSGSTAGDLSAAAPGRRLGLAMRYEF